MLQPTLASQSIQCRGVPCSETTSKGPPKCNQRHCLPQHQTPTIMCCNFQLRHRSLHHTKHQGQIPQRKYAQGYAALTHVLHIWQLQATMNANFSNESFYGAIIDDESSKYLEFCHLINIYKYRNIWMKILPMNLVAWHKASVTCQVPTPLTSFPILMFHLEPPSRMDAFFARTFRRKQKSTARV